MAGAQFGIIVVSVSAAMSAVMFLGWLVWLRTKNSGWVDTVWTFGLGLVGIAACLAAASLGYPLARAGLVAFLIALWSLRLGLHIATRTQGIADDPRYAKLIEDWGRNAKSQMLLLLQKQALVSIPLAAAMALAAFNPAPALRLADMIGALVLLAAIVGEAVADTQLRRFRSDPANKGRLCNIGLWSWSRHPNYFFEWMGWIAYPLIAISFGHPFGWAALLAPACMYWLLVHVSGIPPLEEHMMKKHPQAFSAYRMRTNAFFLAPPRASS